MNVTLVAHACILFESKNTKVITDPILFGYLWEEINVHCPAIDLNIEKIPKVDVLNISHRHQDHFDIRSLAYLATYKSFCSPDTVVLAPQDEILLEVLEEVGLKNITPVRDFEPITVGDLTLTPTPSMNEQDYFPEHGLLVHDGEVTVWNQVDTIVTPDIVNYLKDLYPRINFAHNRFLPLLEGNFSFHQPLSLPFEEYSSFLRVVKAVQPEWSVPGSAGFRYRDEYDFLNQYSFPTTQEQFISDLKSFAPEINTSTFFPGDMAEVTAQGVEIHRQHSSFVKMRENDEYRIEFKPVAEVPRIKTLTVEPEKQEEEWATIRNFVEDEFIGALKECKLYSIYAEWQVVYQLEVFGEKESVIWSLDFRKENLEWVEDRVGRINLYEGIASSELVGLINDEANWDFIGISAQYRYFHNIYRLADGQFECFPSNKKFPAPLMQIFAAGVEMDRRKFMLDAIRWKNHYQR
ncbi:MAG: MBL fold metallo-hydrolase [Candidatus Nitronauta litoralis]|uniref:MBL fold metallo-hydrolase n=1 Tax=Candidatus Nitronauta litoralis TaxID=2705533 RepID=A0A7T0G1F4_9BACT|nr:MAG: MBL fold metallo-hydrolase [Candidatus Nitronauta litoralis]